MNRHFHPYQSHDVPFTQLGKGNMDIFGGSSLYSQGGNGLGGMFRGLVRTASDPFSKISGEKSRQTFTENEGGPWNANLWRRLKRTIVKESCHREN